jgi:hypothetical protein
MCKFTCVVQINTENLATCLEESWTHQRFPILIFTMVGFKKIFRNVFLTRQNKWLQVSLWHSSPCLLPLLHTFYTVLGIQYISQILVNIN